jgi:hypothetical protein
VKAALLADFSAFLAAFLAALYMAALAAEVGFVLVT